MKFSKEIKIALVSLIGVVVLFVGMQFLKGLSVFSQDNSFYVAFDDATGLSVSAPVYANGYRPDSKIIAVIGLNKQMRLPRESHAKLASDLLGNIRINLVLSDDPIHLLEPGDTIQGAAEEGVMSKVAGMVPAIEKMMPKLDSIMTSLNILLADPALRNTLHNVEGMTANLDATSRELHGLSVTLNREVPGMMAKTNGVLNNTQQLTSNLSQIDVARMMAKVDSTLRNVQEMTAKLNSSEGTLGLLMRDKQLYNNLSATAADADSLLIDFKAHPKRYVHFSVFGKKDKAK